MIKKSKTYNKLTRQVVAEHVENIRRLDDEGKLEICGVFKGYPGMAIELRSANPLILLGFSNLVPIITPSSIKG